MMKLFSCAAALSLLCGVSIADTDTQNTYWFADGSVANGNSHLTRLENMVLITVEASGLNPGDAMTLWWVVFNNPAGCTGGVCGDDEFNDPTGAALAAAEVAVGNASGNVVKSDGTLEFGGVLRRNSNDDGHEVVFGAAFVSEYLLTATTDAAEIHVVLQSHGQARGGKKLREQLAFLEANCTPSCADVQFSIHLAPGP